MHFHASPLYENGEGELTGFFTVKKPGVTDEIRVRMEMKKKAILQPFPNLSI